MTEMWLTDKHQHWKDTTELNNNILKMHTADRSDRPGGGLALIHRSKYPCKEKHRGSTPSFEYAAWELNIKNVLLTIHGVYHPPTRLSTGSPMQCSSTTLWIIFQ